jgi:long-chain acyl-CoA synthetase
MPAPPLPAEAASLQEAFRLVLAATRPGRTFLVFDDGGHPAELTYGALAERCARLGALWRSWGLGPGARVFVASRDDSATVALVLGCLAHGLSAVVGSAEARPGEVEHLLGVARPAAAFVDEAQCREWPLAGVQHVVPISSGGRRGGSLFSKLLGRKSAPEGAAAYPALLESLEPLPAPPPDALADAGEAYVLFTSGSTSRPKGVSISRRSLLAHARTLGRQLGYTAESRLLDVLPLHHTDGLIHGCLTAWLHGATALRPLAFRVTAAGELLDAVYTHRATHFITVPTALAILERCADDFADAFRTADFRCVVSSAGYLDERLWQRFQERFGVRVANIYGLTETVVGGLFCGPDEASFRMGTVGRPVDCRVRVVDESGADAAPGQPGELLLAGENLMTGYVDDAAASAEALRGGWLRTGDIVTLDADGLVRIVGRRKNIVITGGLNVHPEEVSEALRGLPGVADAAAFGVEDATFGEVVAACVVAEKNAGLSVEELVAGCRQRLSPYKVPRLLELVPALPKGPSGKVIVAQARELLAHAAAGRAGAGTARGDVPGQLTAIAARVFRLAPGQLSPASVPGNTPGWDSFAQLALVAELEAAFGIRLATADVLGLRSLGDAVRIVRERLGG